MKQRSRISSGKIRIISGRWRGRKLPVLNSSGLHPTTDYVRETLFNWLSPLIANSRCLDCFAGSGALGLEALSRYAASVTLLEVKRRVVRQLKENLVMLKAVGGTVVSTNTISYLSQHPSTAYNVVFVDPPFYKGLLEETIFLLEKKEWLKEKALIYVESEVENCFIPVPLHWNLYREKVTRRVVCRLYHRCV